MEKNLQTHANTSSSTMTLPNLKWFVTEHSSVTDAVLRKQSRLLSSILLAMIVALIIIVTLVLLADPSDINDPKLQIAIGLSVINVLLYIANRAGYVRATMLIFTSIITSVTIFFPLLESGAATLLPFALTSVLIIGMFYSTRITLVASIIMIIVTYIGVEAKGSGFDKYHEMQDIWYFLLLASALLITFVRHIRAVEQARHEELEEINHQLNLLASNLELRVEERTSELHDAKQDAEKAQAEAEKANEVKSQFLANMSHELRTPLNAILNFTAFVADGVMGPVNEQQEDLLNQSISSGKHLLSLINDVLDITKIEAGLMDLFIQEVDMGEALQSASSIGKGLVKDKNVKFITEIDDDLPITFGDKRRLRQVLLNLISNAVKFTSEGQITLKASKTKQGIRIELEDTGIGIPEKDQHLVFKSFKQAKHDFTETIGTGLGMPISKYFVESHQGTMWFESVAGEGSTFYVELPILSNEEADQITLEIQHQS